MKPRYHSAERTDNSRKRFRGRSPDLAMILNNMAACTTGNPPHTKTGLSSYADLLVQQRNQEEISALISNLHVAFPNLFTGEKKKADGDFTTNQATIRVSGISPALPLLALLILPASCNPEKEIHHYFAELGLNRLAVLCTDIQPGSLSLVWMKNQVYRGHTYPHPKFLSGDSFREYQVVIGQYQKGQALSASAAMSFIHGLFQFSPKAELALSGTVRIDMVE